MYINPQQGPREDQYWVVRDADGSIAGEGEAYGPIGL